MNKVVTIIGAGIAGLSCAVLLQEAGFRVCIVTKAPPSETTSAAAAGIWFPYEAGTHPHTAQWAQATYDYCYAMQAIPDSGIFFPTLKLCFDDMGIALPDEFRLLPGFRMLEPADIPAHCTGGYAVSLPFLSSDRLLPFLLKKFTAAGGAMTIREVTSLADEARHADLLVNCTGAGARSLCRDSDLTTAKGHVVVTVNPGLRDCVEEYMSEYFTHIYPSGDICILGGIYEAGNDDLTPDPVITADILARACTLEPALKGARIIAVRTGLRPVRSAVRLEIETLPGGGTVIHNYGHGGSGYTLAHGCALEVAELAVKIAQ